MNRQPPKPPPFPYTTLFRSGKPTQLPWKLKIDDQHVPAGYFGHHYFHPMFLYEFIYDCVGVGILLAVAKYFRIKRPADRKSTRLNSSHLVISYAVFSFKQQY